LLGFTHDNEVKCELRESNWPPETKYKCTHDLPAALARGRLPEGVNRAAAASRKKKVRTGPKQRKAKKVVKKKRKARV
jgi:hypothetical protein